ncbi:sensor histidine kinase [uncultured Sphingomonas sp.]|uniref:sensor histidine kinase n=1 Tax=uncultured Sphingomonas sp. TaxID=158754 RepID=UPI0035CBEB34
MTIVPRSLFGRLLALSTLTTLAALLFAAIGIGHVLERFVIRGLDQQLDAELSMLARAVRPDGTLDRTRIVDLPVFADRASGWGWRVRGAAGSWTGGDAIVLREPFPGRNREGADHRHARPEPRDGVASSGEPVHRREMIVATDAGPVTLVASGPRRVALAPLREAMTPLLVSLALLGAALALATGVQLRVGLRPLRAISAALADVRAGRARHIPADQPFELAPLAHELNALIDQNEAGLAHARRHVANLAHGLKTPLAALGVRLAESGSDPDGSLSAMVAQIDRSIRHHLGRARAATPGVSTRASTRVGTAVDGLITAMHRIHADAAIAVTVDVWPDAMVTVDAQDVDEMLGNLLDNAWRHARSAIAIGVAAIGTAIEVRIDDDGTGIPASARDDALAPGRRLDERGEGYGFGLSITRELAELNGGSLALATSSILGGLSVTLLLPGDLRRDR